MTSNNYFRFSNHRGITALWQLLQRKYQIQFLEAAGYERMKQSHHCSKCSISGHSIKTCTKQCKHCNHQTCCSHLIIWEGKWEPKCCSRSSQSYLDNIYHILSSDVSNTLQCVAKFQSYRLPA